MSVRWQDEGLQGSAPVNEGVDSFSRRQFLGGVGGVTVGALAGGVAAELATAPEAAAQESPGGGCSIGPELGVQRRNAAFQIRHKAALEELQASLPEHLCNGDEALYPNRIGNFHKTLPHDTTTGEVDPAAYNAFVAAIASGDFNAFSSLPGQGLLLNPLGAIGWNLEGPDAAALTIPPPPALASAQLAAEAVELYWMALCRDIPFYDAGGNDNWTSHPTILAACEDLNRFVDLGTYQGPVDPDTGRVTPRVVFRLDAPGCFDGPMVSQLLLRNFVYDAFTVVQRGFTAEVGADFMTDFNEWVGIQNGAPVALAPPIDAVLRFQRDMRDLGTATLLDRIYTQYLKAAHIMQNFAIFATGAGLDPAWPYKGVRHLGFAAFGLNWVWEALAAVGQNKRTSWFQKWNVHRFVRPDAFGGLVHRKLVAGAPYPLHDDLFNVSTVLPRVFAANQARNAARGLGNVGTYLLSQVARSGVPNHPSYPGSHAYQAGACITFMKAIYNESVPWVAPIAPVKPNTDGTATVPYVAGVDGPTLTVGGELNKLAMALATGREMAGVHWRSDTMAGLRLGEEAAIRWLHERNATYREPFTGFTVTKFDGTVVTIT